MCQVLTDIQIRNARQVSSQQEGRSKMGTAGIVSQNTRYWEPAFGEERERESFCVKAMALMPEERDAGWGTCFEHKPRPVGDVDDFHAVSVTLGFIHLVTQSVCTRLYTLYNVLQCIGS